jgi:hypothetical protein
VDYLAQRGVDNLAPGISGQGADIPACSCHSRSKLFEIKLVCKIECFRGEGGLGLDKVTEWFLALDIAKNQIKKNQCKCHPIPK